MASEGSGGSARIAASGVVGLSGKPVRVYSITVKSGGTAGVVQLFNDINGSTAANEKFIMTGTISTGATVAFGNRGKFFPAGCYCAIDANVVYADVDYEQVNI